MIALDSRTNKYERLPVLPLVVKDLSIIVEENVKWEEIVHSISGYVKEVEFVDEYNGISPALVLYFEGSKPMPIRKYRWEEYLPFLDCLG